METTWIQADTTMKPKHRFVVYADFLGTTQRYLTPKLVVRGRELLEQALVQCVVPELSEHDMNLYVFSDTAIVTCPRLIPLLNPISRLFSHFIELMGDRSDASLTLWLRAAISSGAVTHVDHIVNSERIRTIPFLDTSLPTAYKLEAIRKGSRIFIDPSIPDEEFREHKNLFFRWRQITGRGLHRANVTEFLWPAIMYDNEERLAQMTLKVHGWWSEAMGRKEWSGDVYFDRLHHLDETVKLFIRTSSMFCAGDCRRAVLFSLLPKTVAHHKNARYEWGVWFQAMKGLVEGCEADSLNANEVVAAFGILKEVLIKSVYLEHFMNELNFPDYAEFRSTLCRLGLCPGP
jgi:hypothetical protein